MAGAGLRRLPNPPAVTQTAAASVSCKTILHSREEERLPKAQKPNLKAENGRGLFLSTDEVGKSHPDINTEVTQVHFFFDT